MKPESTDKSLQFMPISANKIPLEKKWEQTRAEYDFSKGAGVGLVCGEISGNLEAIDIDLKYDLTGKLFKEYKNAVHKIDPTVLEKLVVQKTVSGGYHFIYKCDFIEGNKKLAQRETILKEKNATFEKSYAHALKEVEKKPEYETQEQKEAYANIFAENASKNDKIRVLLETRGEKGYIACYPTKGYEVKFGSLDNIQKITQEQRQVLFDVAYSFNEVITEFKPKYVEKKQIKGLTPFEDYNDRADVVGLLVNHGWMVVGHKGKKTLLLRPGDTSAKQSGNFDSEKNWFSVFSTSTAFDSQHAYQPYAVYAVLECNKDFAEASRRLYADGYGDRLETVNENNLKVPTTVDLSDDDYSFLATEEDYDQYLDNWRQGTFEMGETTGIPDLDEHFRFKRGNLVITNGVDNVGKSVTIWYLTVLSNLFNKWKWLIFSSENRVGSVVKKLIEFYWNIPIAKLTPEQFKEGKAWVSENYDIIKTGKSMYNYMDLLKMAEKAMRKKKYQGLMIDPYNSLRVDIPVKSKQGTYDYHYEAASHMQLFGQQNELSIYLNVHVGTTGARNVDRKGFIKAPQKADTEFGVMFANKADEFLTIHRVTQHETDWMYTEFHVRKVKETETGGKVTYFHKPIDIRMVNGQSGFEQCRERNFNVAGYNPVKKFRDSTYNPLVPEIKESKIVGNFYEVNKEEITNEYTEEKPPF